MSLNTSVSPLGPHLYIALQAYSAASNSGVSGQGVLMIPDREAGVCS